jgi:hypothetical protein
MTLSERKTKMTSEKTVVKLFHVFRAIVSSDLLLRQEVISEHVKSCHFIAQTLQKYR